MEVEKEKSVKKKPYAFGLINARERQACPEDCRKLLHLV